MDGGGWKMGGGVLSCVEGGFMVYSNPQMLSLKVWYDYCFFEKKWSTVFKKFQKKNAEDS